MIPPKTRSQPTEPEEILTAAGFGPRGRGTCRAAICLLPRSLVNSPDQHFGSITGGIFTVNIYT